jgi:RyR domain
MSDFTAEQIEAAARLAHEVNRGYCTFLGDYSQVPWEEAPEWQRQSSITGVQAVAAGTITTPGDSHRSWLAEKERDGWRYGSVKNPETKEHPCMVEFGDLPADQQAKDFLFIATVKAALFDQHKAAERERTKAAIHGNNVDMLDLKAGRDPA